MLLALLLSVFVLCLCGAKYTLHGFNEDYLSKDGTNSIKGLFILLVIISHSISYVKDCGYSFNGTGDFWFMMFFNVLSQLVVVMFLFYSGYGVGESFKSKGLTYVKAMPRHRILGTLLNFDIAVLAFIVLDLFLGISLTPKQCLFSLTGWTSVGNSNWYIFVILFCYLMTYFTLRLSITRRSFMVIVLFCLCVGFILLLSLFKQSYWYDTILSYPMGFLFSTYRDKLETHIKRNYWIEALALVIGLVFIYLCVKNRSHIGHNAISIVFALTIVVLTMKVRFNNDILKWFGKHLFPIYVYMRMPMLLITNWTPELLVTYPVLFILISMIATVTIARVYKYWEIKL